MSKTTLYTPVVSIIGFHHARGPEVEHWIGVDNENDISEWPLLPFLALADGAHLAEEEDFSYFTLKHEATSGPATLFGISCTRQLDSSELIDRPADVTRSTVQKAVVVIASNPTFFFGHLKQQLSAVTTAWFAQRNFEDLDIIRRFQESLRALRDDEYDRDQYIGLSLRELVYEFRHQTLVLFKCALLQPKMLFFGSRCERLCMTQFSLLSLVPGLLRNLEDCSDPDLNNYESKLIKPTSVKTSDRRSLLKFMGLPLQLFGKGSLFGPYTPLQQLDILADFGTKSYIVGSTNSLLLQQRDRYSDILVNLDENTIEITSSSLRAASVLSAADRRWIDALVLSVTESWDEADPSRPKTMGFVGSEDYIRLQFEEYVLSMVSAVKYHLFLEKHHGSDLNLFLPDIEGDPAYDFQMDWVDNWKMTENFRIFQKFTDSELFDLVPPKHVMAGGLTMEDVQRRIVQQMKELGVDEKVNRGREVVAATLASGRNNVSTVFSNLSKNVEKFREQRRSQDLANLQAQNQAQSQAQNETQNAEVVTSPAIEKPPTAAPVVAAVTPVLAEASTRAGAYFSSWASWAGEKRKKVFTQTPVANPPSEPATGEKSLPNLPADDPPPKKSFEESIFDARMRAAHGRSSSSSSIFSPQRTNSMTNNTGFATERKSLDGGKSVGLGIVNIEPQSSFPAPATELPVGSPELEKVEPALPALPTEAKEAEIPPPAPVKDEPIQPPSPVTEDIPPAPPKVEMSQPLVPAVDKVMEAPKLESEAASPTLSSLSFVRRKMTLPKVEKVEFTQPSTPTEENDAEPLSHGSERAESPPPLSSMERKLTLPKVEKAEPTQSPAVVEEKTVESLEPEQQRAASPPPSLSFMRRKMTLSGVEKIEPIQVSEPTEENAVESPKSEQRVASPPLSLPFMRRKMTLSGAEETEPIQVSEPTEENAVESPKSEERVASPPPSLSFMRRKMTLSGAEEIEPIQVSEPTEKIVELLEPEQQRVASPPPSLPSMRRKMTLSGVEKPEPTQVSEPTEEKVAESPKSERVVSPPPSLPFMRRKMTLSRAEKIESTELSEQVEKSVESPKPEPERTMSPPPSLPFMRRKMTLSRAEKIESTELSEQVEGSVESPKPEPERTMSPPPSLPFMRRKMTLPRVEKVETAQQYTPVEEKAAGSPKSELERATSPPLSLPFMRRRKMTLPKPEKTESTPVSEPTEEKAESPKSEQRAASPSSSLSFMRRKMTLSRAERVEPAQLSEQVESPKPKVERIASPPPSIPVVDSTERPLRPGRLVQSRSFGPTAGETDVPPASDRTERARRSIPTFDKAAVKPLKSERTPEPVKIPEYNRAAPLEVKSTREKGVSRHSRAESAVISGGEYAPKPLKRAETQSAAMISSKTSGESLKAARHARSESNSSAVNTEKLAPRSERVKGSIAERAKRFSQTQDEPSDSGNVSPARAAFAARRAMFEKK